MANRNSHPATATSILQLIGGADRRPYSARQEQILDCLEEVLMTDGFRGLTLGALASRAQCSTRTLYEIASTREDLLIVVLERIWLRVAEQSQVALQEAVDPAAKLAAFLRTALLVIWPSWATLVQDITAYGPASRRFQEHVDESIRLMADLIEQGIEQGQFRRKDPHLLAEFLAAGLIRATSQDVLKRLQIDPLIALEELVSCLLDGLISDE
jgi:AcrR family transcriptional regulator